MNNQQDEKIIICHYCQEQIENPTKDHIVPKSKIKKSLSKRGELPEGFDYQSNTVTACFECNQIKGAKDYDSFIALGIKQIRHLKKFFKEKQQRKKKIGRKKYRKNRI